MVLIIVILQYRRQSVFGYEEAAVKRGNLLGGHDTASTAIWCSPTSLLIPVSFNCWLTARPSVLLARLRTSHTPLLKTYAYQLDTTVDPICPNCGDKPQISGFRSAPTLWQ